MTRQSPLRRRTTLSKSIERDADPLAGLVEKTAEDPGAPFAPDVLASLADLRRTDRAAFETLRAAT